MVRVASSSCMIVQIVLAHPAFAPDYDFLKRDNPHGIAEQPGQGLPS